MKHLLLITILFLSGCHTSYGLSARRFQVTDDFTDEQFEVLQNEVDHLCELTPDCISITRESHQNKIYIGAIEKHCENGGGCFGVFTDDSRAISISEIAMERGELAPTFRHEMGHAAGCMGPDKGNLFEKGNVMHTYVHDIDWTDADLDCIEAGLM